MLDLAISTDTYLNGTTTVETNRGVELRAQGWPQDCDFQLIAFDPSRKRCEVVWTEVLAADISAALAAIDRSNAVKNSKPDWYRRLVKCAKGT